MLMPLFVSWLGGVLARATVTDSEVTDGPRPQEFLRTAESVTVRLRSAARQPDTGRHPEH